MIDWKSTVMCAEDLDLDLDLDGYLCTYGPEAHVVTATGSVISALVVIVLATVLYVNLSFAGDDAVGEWLAEHSIMLKLPTGIFILSIALWGFNFLLEIVMLRGYRMAFPSVALALVSAILLLTVWFTS
eukprot:TRINITY_DN42997_c0_g1_i1.p1 TRINITY_DN42997_c0_g1~~TRINITY_DN42997_c0_g1_i1.p1  ORF type:complete len:129 (+),score=10.90 TRINITY_DN42997_c0_g1_i1:244-630(+)